MKYRELVKRNVGNVIPVKGDRVIEVRLRFSHFPILIFEGDSGEKFRSQLEIWDKISLRRGQSERILDGAKAGATFNPVKLSPLVELLGCEVEDALALHDGMLQIKFTDGLIFEVLTTAAGEHWSFQRRDFSLYGISND